MPARLTFVIDRVAQVAGQVGAHARDRVAHVVDRLLRRLLEAELDRDRRRAVLHLGVDVLDALQRGDRVLDLARDLGLHLRRRGAGQRGGDGDRRQVDVREAAGSSSPGSPAGPTSVSMHEQQDRRRSGCGSTRRRRSSPSRPYFVARPAWPAGAGGLDHAHRVAVGEEAAAGGDDACVGVEPAGDLDAVADAPADCRPWSAPTFVSGADAQHVAEAVAQQHRALRQRQRAGRVPISNSPRANMPARARAAGAAGRRRRCRCASAGRPSARPCAPCRRSRAPPAGVTRRAHARA